MSDKIFNNSFGEGESFNQNINFKLSPLISDIDHDERMHYDLLFEKIDLLIKGSEFEHLNEVTPTGIKRKLNKVQINNVFCYIIKNIDKEYSKIDIFSVVSDYFDVLATKFYSSLSNKYKDELIKELDRKYNILNKKGINKLF